jgi:hypothetical protein
METASGVSYLRRTIGQPNRDSLTMAVSLAVARFAGLHTKAVATSRANLKSH